jgi:regulatory protein
MPPRRNPARERKLKTFARDLRGKSTDAESRLWYLLRDRRFTGHKFRRQHPVADYILDFYCPEQQLAIELDGGQHAEQQSYDERRAHVLAGLGIRVLRFWNHDVLQQTEAVLQVIHDALDTATPHPQPLSPHAGRGENVRPAPYVQEVLPSPHAMGRGAGGEGRAARNHHQPTPTTQSPHARALALLARREHSRAELTRKLEHAGHAREEIAPLLDTFEAKNWLSDRRFAESYVADHRARAGSVKLAYDLRQRGVADALIAAVLADQRDSELERAHAVWQKKFGCAPADAAERARQQRFLLSRGFAAEVIRRVLRGMDDNY